MEVSPCERYTAMENRHPSHSLEVAYEAALAEERWLWKQLDNPQMNVNEGVMASARWSAAAERARAIAQRIESEASAQPH